MKDTLISRLAKIQQELKAPKNQFNKFGNYKYRSCEDILEAVKPLLNGLALNLTDEVKEAAGYMYVEATAIITDGNKMQAVKAQAGIDPTRKGMGRNCKSKELEARKETTKRRIRNRAKSYQKSTKILQRIYKTT